jgi:hypothetical protein
MRQQIPTWGTSPVTCKGLNGYPQCNRRSLRFCSIQLLSDAAPKEQVSVRSPNSGRLDAARRLHRATPNHMGQTSRADPSSRASVFARATAAHAYHAECMHSELNPFFWPWSLPRSGSHECRLGAHARVRISYRR